MHLPCQGNASSNFAANRATAGRILTVVFFDFGRTPVGKGLIFQAADVDADFVGGCRSCTLKNLRGLACKGRFRAVPSLIQ